MNFILFHLKFIKFKPKIKFIKFEHHNYGETDGVPVVDDVRRGRQVRRVAVVTLTQSSNVTSNRLGTGSAAVVGRQRNGPDQSHDEPDRNRHAL